MIGLFPVWIFFLIIFPLLAGGTNPCESDAFVNPLDRWVGLTATINTRDIGGYRTRDYLWVRRGVLYRSDRLELLTNEDVDKIKSLGIRSVVDLRDATETLTYPDVDFVRTSTRYIHFPIEIQYLPTVEDIYLDIISTYAHSVAGVFHEIADSENLPLIYHCMWGKDRTGIVTALIHSLLGVPRELIIADYMLSGTAGFSMSPGWIEAVLNRVDEEGGIAAFLLARGVDQKIQAAVRANLLEVPSSNRDWELFK